MRFSIISFQLLPSFQLTTLSPGIGKGANALNGDFPGSIKFLKSAARTEEGETITDGEINSGLVDVMNLGDMVPPTSLEKKHLVVGRGSIHSYLLPPPLYSAGRLGGLR
jgi:hypothetical protein